MFFPVAVEPIICSKVFKEYILEYVYFQNFVNGKIISLDGDMMFIENRLKKEPLNTATQASAACSKFQQPSFISR